MHDNLDYSTEILNEMAGITDYSSTGFASWLSNVPTTTANEWKALRDSLTARLGLDKLMELKAGSATGASGLGALSEKELLVLQNYMGNLDQAQTPGKIKREMTKVYGQLQKLQNTIRKDQNRNSKKYNRLAPKYLQPDQMINNDQWLDIPIGKTPPLEGRKSEATRTTPKVLNTPFKASDLIPGGLTRDPTSQYQIGDVIDGYKYIGGDDTQPGSWQEVN